MNKIILLGILSILLASSCKKEEEKTEPSKTESLNYMPMEIGNYWVYDNYIIDSLGIERNYNIEDSIIISKDTLINSNTYYKFDNFINKSNHFALYMRDSSGYIIDNKGVIYLSNTNFTDTLWIRVATANTDTLFTASYKMEQTIESITVPVGTFNDIVNYRGTIITYNPENGITNPRYTNNYYAKDIGRVKENSVFLRSNNILEKRLIKYHINSF